MYPNRNTPVSVPYLNRYFFGYSMVRIGLRHGYGRRTTRKRTRCTGYGSVTKATVDLIARFGACAVFFRVPIATLMVRFVARSRPLWIDALDGSPE